MATTKQVLRLQSDQILDGPQIGTNISLQDLAATRKLILDWAEPAVTDRTLTFRDPTADDYIVYENLAQTLANKTLTAPSIADFSNAQHTHADATNGGQISHAVLTNLTTGDPHTQYVLGIGRNGGQQITGGTAASDNLTLQSTSNPTKGVINVLDDLVMGSGKNVTLSGGGELVGLPASPSDPTAAASKAYVDSAVSGGVSWRETLLSSVQLDSGNNAIAQAVAFYLVNDPIAGDTFTIRDGTTTETWTFQGASAAFQPAIGGSALLTMQNLAARINTDSTAWAASVVTTLQSINPTGNVVIIYRKVPTAAPTDRIYGIFTTPADAKYVNYGGSSDYRSSTTANLPGADPGTANFGFGRVTAGLSPGEAHIVRAEDSAYIWNDDLGIWQLSAGAVALATSAPGGGTVGQATYDSGKGLQVTAGVAEVKVDGSSVTFNGSGQLSVAGGAVPTGTSAPGGGIQGKVSADENFGLEIAGGVMRTKVDNTSITYDLNGALQASGAPLSPTGLVSHGVLLTRDIPGIAAPSPGFIASDIPTLDYPDGSTSGQLFDFVVPDDYDAGNIEIRVLYQMAAAQAADLRLETQAKIVKQSGSVDTTTFPATPSTLTVANDVNNHINTVLTLTNVGGLTFTRGDTIQVYVKRLGGDVLDTHNSAWRVVAFQYRYTGQVSTRLGVEAADIFTAVAGEAQPPAGLYNTDIPTLDYSAVSNQAAACFFVVPDHWDGLSDGLLRLQYALGSASAGTVRITTFGNIANVVTGATTAIASQNFDVSVTADTNPHRTVIVRSIPGATLSKGSLIQLAIKRDVAVGGNANATFQLLNATLTFGVAPIAGVSNSTTVQLSDGIFGNPTGTVQGDLVFPDFATDFELYYRMASSSAAGALHCVFGGRLFGPQTQISNLQLFVKGVGANPQYNLKIYAEGSGSTPVYASGLVPAPGAITSVVVPAGSMSAQPTGNKRYFVVVEAAIDAGEEVLISRPVAAQD